MFQVFIDQLNEKHVDESENQKGDAHVKDVADSLYGSLSRGLLGL